MIHYFRISKVCTACGQPTGRQPGLAERFDGFELRYQLCGSCREARGPRTGLDLLPIDGSQPCFFCEGAARRVSHHGDVFEQVRQRRLHYTCLPCHALEQEAFKRQLARLHREYRPAPTFPAELIADLDAEVRRAAGEEGPPPA